MTARLPFTQASIKRAVTAARKAGLTVTGIASDGTVLVQDGENLSAGIPGIVPVLETTAPQPPRSKWES